MRIAKLVSSLAIACSLFVLLGCPPSPGPGQSPQDAQVAKLSKTWKCTAATLASSPQTGYTNFQLVISGTPGQTTFGFTTTGRPAGTKSSPWPSSGTLTFGTDFATTLTRDDGLPITYSVSDTQLQM